MESEPAPLKESARGAPRNLPAVVSRRVLGRFPFQEVGRLDFRAGGSRYLGSGTLIRQNVVLTAAHNLWDPKEGWSTNMTFRRALYFGSFRHKSAAQGLYLFMDSYQQLAAANGAASNQAFSADIGWAVLADPAGGPRVAAYRSNYRALTGHKRNIVLGYGAELHSGEVLLAVEPSRGYRQVLGAYFGNSSYGTEGGMSGGPVFAFLGKAPYLVGIAISGTRDFRRSGIRAIDPALVERLDHLP